MCESIKERNKRVEAVGYFLYAPRFNCGCYICDCRILPKPIKNRICMAACSCATYGLYAINLIAAADKEALA